MNILIVYDSFYGNTKKIAETIYDEMTKENNVTIRKADNLSNVSLSDIDLIVIGSPTRGFTATKNTKEFVKNISLNISRSITFAVFDTRIDIEKVDNKFLTFMEKRFGYSNDTIEKMLRKKLAPKVHYEKFYVADSEGPLVDGEIERAIEFAQYLLNNQ